MMVTLMTMSGCTGLVDNDEDSNDPKTILDLGEPIMRSTGAPELIKYSDCDELEFALKLSIEEETRTSLLQAVEELYYWGGGWMEDDMEMAADSSSSSPSSSETGVQYQVNSSSPPGDMVINWFPIGLEFA